ncbi:hypothetical protein VNO77_31574 [Canavalia gladiata]|uniref:Uncharacterized protein n=1 Tax=Canavalia gladiata TaxID=3824 RepID=A0AAN9KRZ3_CANGL
MTVCIVSKSGEASNWHFAIAADEWLWVWVSEEARELTILILYSHCRCILCETHFNSSIPAQLYPLNHNGLSFILLYQGPGSCGCPGPLQVIVINPWSQLILEGTFSSFECLVVFKADFYLRLGESWGSTYLES